MKEKALKDCNLKEINTYIELKFENDKDKILCVNLFSDCCIEVDTLDRKLMDSGEISIDKIVRTFIKPDDIIEVE